MTETAAMTMMMKSVLNKTQGNWYHRTSQEWFSVKTD